MAAKKKVTLYVPEDMLEETKAEAIRQDRSISWIMQTAWRLAREEMSRYPGVDDLWTDLQERDAS